MFSRQRAQPLFSITKIAKVMDRAKNMNERDIALTVLCQGRCEF